MVSLNTKNGLPLTVRGDKVFNADGDNFGYVRGNRVYGLDGGYRGTIVNNRLIYRSTESAKLGSARGSSGSIGASGRAPRAGTAAWGDEPNVMP